MNRPSINLHTYAMRMFNSRRLALVEKLALLICSGFRNKSNRSHKDKLKYRRKFFERVKEHKKAI